MSLAEELVIWLNNDSEREELLIREAPIGKSTLRATKNGRYNPDVRLEKAIRDVMTKHPLEPPERKAASG